MVRLGFTAGGMLMPARGALLKRSRRTPDSQLSSSRRQRGTRIALSVAVTAGSIAGFIMTAQLHSLAVVVAALVLGVLASAAGVWTRTAHPEGPHGRLLNEIGDASRDAGVALVTGAVLGLVLLPVDEDRFVREQSLEDARIEREQRREEDRTEREERRDNLRFVRDLATERDPVAKPFASLDLREADLAGLDLSGADLRSSDLRGASLWFTDLSGADLTLTNLSGTDLSKTPLREAVLLTADLSDADLRGVVLTDAALLTADLTDADLTNSVAWRANLSGANLTATRLNNADLTGADLSGANLTDASLRGAVLTSVIYDDTTVWPRGFTPPSRPQQTAQ